LYSIRLIEMDAIGPVPLCGMILPGLGAEIVRICRPGGQQAWSDVGDAVLLRGRKSVSLNLKSEADRATLLDLVSQADGIIEGGRPGVMERLGLGLMSASPAIPVWSMVGPPGGDRKALSGLRRATTSITLR